MGIYLRLTDMVAEQLYEKKLTHWLPVHSHEEIVGHSLWLAYTTKIRNRNGRGSLPQVLRIVVGNWHKKYIGRSVRRADLSDYLRDRLPTTRFHSAIHGVLESYFDYHVDLARIAHDIAGDGLRRMLSQQTLEQLTQIIRGAESPVA